MARLLIDLRMVRGALHGIARYALELSRHLTELAPSWELLGLTGPDGLPSDLGALTPRFSLVRCRAGFLSPAEQPALLESLLRVGPDLFHATSFSVPALWTGPLVATVHDVNHLAVPESRSPSRTAYYQLVVSPRCRRARGLITVSQFSRDEIVRRLGIAAERVEVIHNGVDPLFHPRGEEELADFRRRRALPDRYFVAVGSEKPHKNLEVLRRIADSLPAPLVLLAGRGARRALHFSERVIELSLLNDDELARLYAGASALLFPSRYEGFGLPALEALASGTPVVASRAGALPEVLGDAGVLLPPDDGSAWRDAAARLFRDGAWRASLTQRGVARAADFTWRGCAHRTLEVYRRALPSSASA